ncbi:TPA: hypothetical protein G9F27_005762 [Salmonella enterica]|uniref:Uncharacterized protein n=1 Tax=Salmonella enterica TaxID=28901 RepID=A0A743SND3_SALER|nr:hypothetical protein [Salmonella enterica]
MAHKKLRVSVRLDTRDLQERLTDLIQANVITKDGFGDLFRLLKGDLIGLRKHIVLADASSATGAGNIGEVIFKVEVDRFVDAIAAAVRAGDVEGYNIAHS